MAKDILKEAIADAKAVREVALANAKAALEEAFTPKLQSMLSARLSEDMDEDMNETEMEEDMDETYGMEEEMDETMYDEDMDETMGMEKEAKDDMEEDLDEEIDLEEILNELGLEEELAEETVAEGEKDVTEGDEKVDEAKKKKSKDDEDEEVKKEAVGYPNHNADQVQKVKHDATDINRGLNEGEEFDLDALLKEIESLEEKEDDDVKKEAKDMDEDKDDMKEAEETNEAVGAAVIAGIYIGSLPLLAIKAKVDMMSSEDRAAWAQRHPKLNKLMTTLGAIGSGAASAKRREEGVTEEKVATDAEMAKAEKELAEIMSETVNTELEETKAALKTIRNELNEVNLLNSKLLYVNRIFKANQLDESQKLRVVETLDKAESTKEAKLIYETIKDTFNVAKSKKGSIKAKARIIKEGLGMASKAAGTSTAPKKEVISESNNMVSRFQKLANIKINQ